MKKENWLDGKARSPEPDDLSSESLPQRRDESPAEARRRTEKPNPDVSAPHIPPPD
jgi:hypothetical protein